MSGAGVPAEAAAVFFPARCGTVLCKILNINIKNDETSTPFSLDRACARH
jgi:hypothetical protein